MVKRSDLERSADVLAPLKAKPTERFVATVMLILSYYTSYRPSAVNDMIAETASKIWGVVVVYYMDYIDNELIMLISSHYRYITPPFGGDCELLLTLDWRSRAGSQPQQNVEDHKPPPMAPMRVADPWTP